MSELSTLVSEQQRDAELLDKAIDGAHARVAGLDQSLRADVLRDRATALREETVKSTADLRAALARRSETAAVLAKRFSPEGERRHARFNNDDATNAAIAIAVFAKLSRTSTRELLAHLQDAVESNNLAQSEAIRLEFTSRADASSLKESFAELFGKLKHPQADAAKLQINRISGLRAMADVRVTELIRGQSDPLGRITAARVASAA